MPLRDTAARLLDEASSDVLVVEEVHPGFNTVFIEPSAKSLNLSDEYRDAASPVKIKFIEVNESQNWLAMYPINTLPGHERFLRPKYKQLESVVLIGFDFSVPASSAEVRGMLEGLPSGFVQNVSYGLGLLNDYRYIINTIEKMPAIKHLIIQKDGDTSVEDEFYSLNFSDFEILRKAINRINTQFQRESSRDKWMFAHNVLLTGIDDVEYPELTEPYKDGTIFRLIAAKRSKSVKLSEADRTAAVRIVDANKREIARNAPRQLLRLRNDLEQASLEVLIAKYGEMLGRDLQEARWQQLFNDNPFILNLAFGYPVVKIQDQAHVGGRRLSGSGETIADFLVKNGISNNAALFEIKKPGTPLLNKKPYRGDLYTPSSDLAGAMNQMLDQKNEFQKDIARLKENSRIYDLESYAVHGVLVIGKTPADRDQQKSFELFRGNSKDVTIITFDELLAKLKSLYDFLSTHAPGDQQVSVLHALETKLLKTQQGFHELYRYSESKSGSGRIGTATPLPGVDGTAVMSASGRLSVLKTGFENARLEKSSYPIGFDEAGERIVKVDTLEEFMIRAGEAITEAESVLTMQQKAKLDE
jgi:Domain of unknown function (DUF4263)